MAQRDNSSDLLGAEDAYRRNKTKEIPVRRCAGILRYACIYCDAQCFAEHQKMTAQYGTTYGASDKGVLLQSATFDEFSAAGYAIQDS